MRGRISARLRSIVPSLAIVSILAAVPMGCEDKPVQTTEQAPELKKATNAMEEFVKSKQAAPNK